MKRFLHALAALWPKRKEVGNPPAPPTSTGLRQHLAAVIRMERHVSECANLPQCGCADSPIRKFAKETVGAGAPGDIVRSSGRTELSKPKFREFEDSPNCKSANNDQSVAALGEFVQSDGGLKLSKRQQSKFANSQIRESAIKLTIVIPVFFMCLMAAKQVSAQAEPAAAAAIKPLQIGDTIPEELWHLPLQVVNHPDGKETITLNDYRGKLIILDFWGTFCASCIAAMPKIAEVQRQFADDMVVIPVSWSKPEATEQALQTHRTLAPLGLPSVVDAKILIDAFPHGVVPHYAWIDPQGSVVATTATNDVTHANIAKVLEGKEPDYALATFIDIEKPLLFAAENLPKGTELNQYSVFIRGPMVSLGSSVRLRKSRDTVNGMAISNRKLSSMYSLIASKLKDENIGKRLVLVDPIADDILCTFDFVVPTFQSDSLYHFMLDMLNQTCGYTGNWVKRSRQSLVLVKAGRSNDYMSSSGEKTRILNGNTFQLKQFPMDHLVSRLNGNDISGERMVINETDYDGPVDITLHAPFDDFGNILRQLNEQGLDLIEAEREIEVFEIRKSSNHHPFQTKF